MTAIGTDRNRQRLNFPDAVEKAFSFLEDLGFERSEVAPTLVRYQKDKLILNVYHGRTSYELGVEIGPEGEQYSMSELIRFADPNLAAQYRNQVAATPAEVASGVKRLSELVKEYGLRAVNDKSFFASLGRQRKAWSEQYALDVLADQIRPKAEAAFREGRYRDAVELYSRIGPRLSPAEQKKLQAARKRTS